MKTKVLLVACNGLGKGGVQEVIMSIVRNLNHSFIFDIVLFTNEKRYYDDEFNSYGGEIFVIPKYEGNIRLIRRLDTVTRSVRIYTRILKLLNDYGPYNAIHCNNDFESGVCLKAANKAQIPIRIAHSHRVYQFSRNFVLNILSVLYKELIARYSTEKVGCSEAACQSMFGKKTHFRIINNPYNHLLFNPTMYSSKVAELTMTQIGNFNKNKNQVFSIKVMKHIVNTYPQAKLHLVGADNDNYLNEILASITQEGLENNIVIHQYDVDTPFLLSQSSGFLFPSISEGFGIVLIEAQAMGVRCYASDRVPRSTNCGGCTYLSLDMGTEHWSEIIISDYVKFSGKKGSFDCSAFFEERVILEYEEIYKGITV